MQAQAEATVGSTFAPRVWFRALRPKQWTKNGLLLAPLLFSKHALHGESVTRALIGFVAFCGLSSAVYLANDWMDREQDRHHPEKRLRPIAAGLLGGYGALALGAACLAVAVFGAVRLGGVFAAAVGAYAVLQAGYTTAFKRMVILDVVAIALGFLLRVVAGAAAVDVPVSNWLYLCTLLLAFFLGFAKRRHELSSLQGAAEQHRKNLSEYSLPMLDQMMTIVAAACIVAYGLYTVSEDTIEKVGSDGLKYTVPFVLYGIFRYLFLIHRRNAGGSPEKVLLSDVPLMVTVLGYVAVSAWVLYG